MAIHGDILLLDGATGSELDRRGVDVSLPLWSARALMDAPDVVRAIHEDYLRAGAGAITTNTFRTQRRTLERAGWGDRVVELVTRAVELAEQAKRAVNEDAIVLGSVAPLEDCYKPDSAPTERVCSAEHGEAMDTLLEAGVDMLLLETMGTQREAIAAAQEAETRAPGRWLLSFCMKRGEPGVLISGEPLLPVLKEIGRPVAIGFNCLPAVDLVDQIEFLSSHRPVETHILAYANVGYANDEGGWVNTDADDPKCFAKYAMQWIDAGATIIGGCCGTSPETIAAIHHAVR